MGEGEVGGWRVSVCGHVEVSRRRFDSWVLVSARVCSVMIQRRLYLVIRQQKSLYPISQQLYKH